MSQVRRMTQQVSATVESN